MHIYTLISVISVFNGSLCVNQVSFIIFSAINIYYALLLLDKKCFTFFLTNYLFYSYECIVCLVEISVKLTSHLDV